MELVTEESEGFFTAHSTTVVINVLQVDGGLVVFLFREGAGWSVRTTISTPTSLSVVLLLIFPALVVNLIILADEILQPHVLPALILLVEEALAPGHVEHRAHPRLGKILFLKDCWPHLLFTSASLSIFPARLFSTSSRSPTSTFLPLAFLNFSFLHLFPGSTLPLPSSASTSSSLLFIQVHLLAPLHRRSHPGSSL